MKSLAAIPIAIVFLALAGPVRAHVGSPDVFLEGQAGPYRLFVTVRVPQVIPGVAEAEIRSESNDVSEVRIAPMQLTGPGSQFAPAPDLAQRSKSDPQFFTASLWLMEFGSLQLRIQVDGPRGKGEMAVPVPAVAQRTLAMQKALGIPLFAVMLVLGWALVSIAAAAVREGDLEPGTTPARERSWRARFATVIAGTVVILLLFVGREWWHADAARFASRVYTPPEVESTIEPNGQLVLRQRPVRIAAGNPRRPADVINFENLIPDHDHLMHFFMVRTPGMDSFLHLHPVRTGNGTFVQDLPPVPPGHYDIFADVVLSSGFPVTMIGSIDVLSISGKPLSGDDSEVSADPIVQGAPDTKAFSFPDGARILWDREAGPLKAGVPLLFRFRVENRNGTPATDLEPYMGMAAHAEIVRSDGSVFAHVHPFGSVSMAALDLAQSGLSGSTPIVHAGMAMPMGDAPMTDMLGQGIGSEISFPYGFPKPGLYRLFVQIKRAGQVKTGVFDATVE